jgi:hypothetical protein
MFNDIDSVIRENLQHGERVLWSGRPPQGFRLQAADAFLIPFSIFWTGFSIFWETMAAKTGAPWFFVLWGVPFILVGIYLLVGRFAIDAKQRGNTYYALTDSRVMIVSGIFSRSTRSFNVRNLSEIGVTKRTSGGGTITLGPVNPMYAWWGNAAWPGAGRALPPTLELDGEVSEVYEKIIAVQKNEM